MQQIVKNKYLKGFKFSTFKESLIFFNNQKTPKKLSIEETFGENYYCYVCYHSLTKELQFVLSFSSDESEDNLNLFFWDSMMVLHTGKTIYFIDENLLIRRSIEIYIYLRGLFLINNIKLLILEEASFKIVNYKGEILKSESFDLIENASIKDNLLYIRTNEENRIIELENDI